MYQVYSMHGKREMPEPVEYVPEGHEAQTAELVAPARDMESARDRLMRAGLMRKRQVSGNAQHHPDRLHWRYTTSSMSQDVETRPGFLCKAKENSPDFLHHGNPLS